MADTDTTTTTEVDATPTTTQESTTTELGDAGKAALDAERKARRDAEKQLKALQTQVQEFENAGKSDLDKALANVKSETERADQLAARLNTLLKASAVKDAATAAKAVDADVVLALIADEVQVSDDGDVTGVDTAIARLMKSKPHLFNGAPTGWSDGAPKHGKPGRTTADEFATFTANF